MFGCAQVHVDSMHVCVSMCKRAYVYAVFIPMFESQPLTLGVFFLPLYAPHMLFFHPQYTVYNKVTQVRNNV